jgi:segregation and condensation protein B
MRTRSMRMRRRPRAPVVLGAMGEADETPAAETAADVVAEPEGDADRPSEDVAEDVAGDELTGDEVTGNEAPAEPRGAEKPEKRGPDWAPPPPERLQGAIEAILLVSGDVLRLARLRDLLGMASVVPVREALAAIAERWQAAGLAMELEQVAGGVRVVTRPEYAEYVGRLGRRPPSDKLTRTQLETLCIVAYKQPVGRAEVERIRGVQSGDPLRALLERRLIKVAGRSDQPGRPLLYGTTQGFLTAFGLDDLGDLPSAKDLKRL